ncbi:LOW QUALITY PROTEIN: hypothetical protein CFC21_032546 [Triticum aestivum]|uniref:Peptidase C1A papain C-terminal domain-containing protein n=2 Tax=Triticum aestivum TaxID=4565 RepID=A0A3B6DMJ2_WHEAT|nr:LOW QUALITY PROTEIN: hypothetical protein CFC21_032546 [Triticum aestivum]
MALAAWHGLFVFGLWICVKEIGRIAPSEIDWVEAGVVSPIVRKQQNCGSCWAIAVASSVEAVHYMNTLQSVSLSVQELIDCDTENDGCDGSLDDLQKYKGGILDYEPNGDYTGSRHAVLIVGYGTDSDGVKYWRFKNSWGEDWGEGGFGRIRRHIADKRGVLGIFMHQEYIHCLWTDQSIWLHLLFVKLVSPSWFHIFAPLLV